VGEAAQAQLAGPEVMQQPVAVWHRWQSSTLGPDSTAVAVASACYCLLHARGGQGAP
jgi:hypothetical protein